MKPAVKRLTPAQIENYFPGKGCKCHAWVERECCCNTWNSAMTEQDIKVDWTPKEVYVLRNENHELEVRCQRLEQLFLEQLLQED